MFYERERERERESKKSKERFYFARNAPSRSHHCSTSRYSGSSNKPR